MGNRGQFGAYDIDICLCIDKTGSMSPIIDTVKNNALNLYDDIVKEMEDGGKPIGQCRIRVIWFGDYGADKNPMLMSDFLMMPEQKNEFRKLVQSIDAYGGGDDPENGLEALAYAIRSDWCTTGWRQRHIIALFTDAPAHALGDLSSSPRYPKENMPADFTRLSMMWGDVDHPGEMSHQAKRLLLFAPMEYKSKKTVWSEIKTKWENVICRPVKEDLGLKDVNYQAVLDTIVNSV